MSQVLRVEDLDDVTITEKACDGRLTQQPAGGWANECGGLIVALVSQIKYISDATANTDPEIQLKLQHVAPAGPFLEPTFASPTFVQGNNGTPGFIPVNRSAYPIFTFANSQIDILNTNVIRARNCDDVDTFNEGGLPGPPGAGCFEFLPAAPIGTFLFQFSVSIEPPAGTQDYQLAVRIWLPNGNTDSGGAPIQVWVVGNSLITAVAGERRNMSVVFGFMDGGNFNKPFFAKPELLSFGDPGLTSTDVRIHGAALSLIHLNERFV